MGACLLKKEGMKNEREPDTPFHAMDFDRDVQVFSKFQK